MSLRLLAAVAASWLAITTLAPPAAAQTATAVEFYYAAYDHYFISIDPVEIHAIDTGHFAGWTRTGHTFDVYASPAAGRQPVCRFFTSPLVTMGSHFYTPNPAECEYVKSNPYWQYEEIVFHVPVPAADGTCPAGTRPVYRMFNNGHGGSPNHRYTTELSVRATMLAADWAAEGEGPAGVSFCSPLPVVTASAAAGIWTGTTSLNEHVRTIVVDDGRYFILYSSPGATDDSGVWAGTATVGNGTFASANGKRYPIAQAGETSDQTTAITLSGTFVAHATLDLTITDTRGTRTVSAAYVAGSDQPISIAAAAGVYSGFTGHVNGRQVTNFTLTSNGTFGGTNPACSFAGTATPRALVAVADMTLNATSGSCIFGFGPVDGVVDYDAAAKRLRVYMPLDGGGDLYYALGSKP
jgi:hypothetical protein